MLAKPTNKTQLAFYRTFEEQLSHQHPLYLLSHQINWQLFEDCFAKHYSHEGRPAKPIRLMVALLLLKHIRKMSDETVVEQWCENSYFQYFSGEKVFASGTPCGASELVHFRNRIGEEGIELIFKEGKCIKDKDSNKAKGTADTAIQEKNINSLTVAKLYKKIVNRCKSIYRIMIAMDTHLNRK